MNSKEILTRLATGLTTEAEKENFSQWVQHLTPEDYKNMLLEYESIMAHVEVSSPVNEALLQIIHQRIEEIENPVVVMRPLYWIKRFAVAASFIAIIGTVVFFLDKKSSKQNDLAIKPQIKIENIQPGKEGAMLVLDNGQKILLDTVQDGTVIKIKGIQITKKDRQIIYETEQTEKAAIVYNSMITPRGRQFSLELADGTKVWLNSLSSIRYLSAFKGNVRRVEITGEAYFEVAKNTAMPFIVNVAGKSEVEVLGTHFNINSYGDEPSINTTLLEGSVKVTGLATRNSRLIAVGQQAQLNSDGAIVINNSVDIDEIMAWKNGMFEFNNIGLPIIVRQMSRWYDVDIILEGKPGNKHFGGAINKNLPLEVVLKMMKGSGITYYLEKNKLVIQQ